MRERKIPKTSDRFFPRPEFDDGQRNLLRHVLVEAPEIIHDNAKKFLTPYIRVIADELNEAIRNLTKKCAIPLLTRQFDPISKTYPEFTQFNLYDLLSKTHPDPFIYFRDHKEGQKKLQEIAQFLKGSFIVGIDESRQDPDILSIHVSYLRSLAFGMGFSKTGKIEQIYPVISQVYVQTDDEALYEDKVRLSEYLRNLVVAIEILTSGEKQTPEFTSKSKQRSLLEFLTELPTRLIVFHGPLIRAIGPFSELWFNFTELQNIIRMERERGSTENLPSLLVEFNDACSLCPLRTKGGIQEQTEWGKKTKILGCNGILKGHATSHYDVERDFNLKEGQSFSQTPDPKDLASKKAYPGLCLYFFLLEKLCTLAKSNSVYLVGVPEVIRSSEFIRLALPSILSEAKNQNIGMEHLDKICQFLKIDFQSRNIISERFDLISQLLRRMNLSDTKVFTYILEEGQYTSSVPIVRYLSKEQNRENFLFDIGLDTRHYAILHERFPTIERKFYMFFLRTTALRSPIRVEYFQINDDKKEQDTNFHFLALFIYFLSLPYQHYGLPVLIKYVDYLSRLPTQFVDLTLKSLMLDYVNEDRIFLNILMDLMGMYKRGFKER